jgi:prophage maintenance system killer protein
MNGISLEDPKQKLLEAMLSMAQGKLSKQQFAQVLRILN